MNTTRNIFSMLGLVVIVLTSGTLPGDEAASAAMFDGKSNLQPDSGKTILQLASGNKIEGIIVKRTESTLFIDVGYTILSVPRDKVSRITTNKASAKSSKGSSKDGGAAAGKKVGAKIDAAKGKRETIFYTSENLESGPVEVKAREVAQGVVKIICAGNENAPAKSGSGFVLDDEEGYIVTNYHVIEKEGNLSVIIYMKTDRGLQKVKKSEVKIVAFNPYFDLALLKLEDMKDVKLSKVFLGDYGKVALGDPVFAVGSPLGLERSVSQGIVSNRNRAVSGLLYIQTTAAINPGNSGGALFNSRGEVIGVTNMKFTGGESLGFAIPVHHLKDFLRNYQAFAYDKDNPNTGIRYLQPPSKSDKIGRKQGTN